MLYGALRAAAAISLRWYYADVVVHGLERAPRDGPLVIIANHPNALVDALLVGTTLPRRVLLTAKATLFETPPLAMLLEAIGVVPLRRAKDEMHAGTSAAAPPMRDRNAEAFRLVTAALRESRAILVFPEGISHDDPSIAPLKSGAARMALQARADGAVGLHILPVGLIFEEKERPGSRVLVRVGEPLPLDEWVATTETSDAVALTSELDERLRAVTLNFATAARAAHALDVARTLAAIATAPVPLDAPRSLEAEADIARRVDAAMTALASAPPQLVATADALTTRMHEVERALEQRGATLADVRISSGVGSGIWFAIREGAWAVVAALAAMLGGWTHWAPLALARRLSLVSLRSNGSRDQPAMRTILFGIGLLPVWYAAIAAALLHWGGWRWATTGVLLLFVAAHAHRLLRGRLSRALRRASTYVALRADPALQSRVVAELEALLDDVIELERALVASA